MNLLKIVLLLAFFTATSTFAQPQQKFKLVTSIFSPGSFGPFLQALTADVSKDNNIELTVEHAPGGGGAVAYNKFQSSNLSTTLLLSTQALWNIAPLMPNNETGMTPENLIPVVMVGSNKFCLLASEDSKISTFNDVIQRGKNQTLFYNSYGSPSGMEPLMFEYIESAYNLSLEPINYKTMNEQLIALSRNDLQLALVTSKICTSNLPRNTNVVGYTANNMQPSVPAKFHFQSMVFLTAHKNMPQETQDYLAKVISAAMIKNRDRYETMVGQPDKPFMGRELKQMLDAETTKWRKVINKVND